MAQFAWWSAPEATLGKNVNNKIHDHILYKCYKLCLFHQLLK